MLLLFFVFGVQPHPLHCNLKFDRTGFSVIAPEQMGKEFFFFNFHTDLPPVPTYQHRVANTDGALIHFKTQLITAFSVVWEINKRSFVGDVYVAAVAHLEEPRL